MPTYSVERTEPGASAPTPQPLKEISARSNAVVEGLGQPYRWIRSYVAADKLSCLHEAESAGGFSADSVTEVGD